MTAPFFLGIRVGAAPLVGNTLRAHYIDPGTQLSICGVGTRHGWAAGAGGSAISTDLGTVTCGACLAALSRENLPPSGA